ncbi:hypothetical protein I6U48_23635 [Clostridium sp. PL3]|uniref:Uncharacterized protein n=1 Tax=Clostridium thailandense TaxID=2794346 RepID=A0A949TYE2_9CLOT|nr:hypothetical protein [Clostridium thailandense]MBV7275891.1 hypothetical protein [Clostridium thailandense]
MELKLLRDIDIYCDEKKNSKRKGMPIMVYPNSNADFYYSSKTKEEKYSYLIEDDDCIYL